MATAGSESERLAKVLEYLEKHHRTIQEIRTLLGKSSDQNEKKSLEIKRKVSQIFGYLNAIEVIIGGKKASKLHEQIERLQEQWLWIDRASNVFHTELGEVPVVWELWLTNASTIQIGFDKKKKWSLGGNFNPVSHQYDGNVSVEDL
jgi:hypothetical protein